MARREELQEEQWALVEPLLPKRPRRADGRGRPRCEDRAMLNGILWILRSGARWQDLPDRFPLVSDVPSAVSALGCGWHARSGLTPPGGGPPVAGTH